ncbi:citrate lyase holo-[acyl-carrier protein] synthase [Lachnospiraceae bacterium AM25-11LB]|jgi:holo-ACP synthase/triphosphoribosyl-dephospho-CoA synthase|uniref:citrate lyase holo-[acyl-carrier protein] synthase n=1 Tax=Blautia hansenii TaxID=1322 RepID=UPI000E3EF003|nr:citrate lyase holo-[acyl-carrier protein] synthase [Lachnospiraceae bacterium AM25-22]RGD08680.1 citrate lyase holo-[acyl-carrier protein] synthase [Lachnospiraceae bacterium AM25-11LB]RJW12546.1 citrate lyase holo-[acyl-carrier protein] synthase [Lachnospiraceae bacterium AM25-40]RJW16884.1 citrate lyase holo-[acyl-carrier protein] synthase [Lachnospiraceae bacterium AM25-39]
MKQELWTSGKDVSMAKILDARENRVQIQQEMLQKSPSCLLSFTLNIPGPVKVFPYTKWTYEVGISIILKGISLLNGVIIEQKEVKKDTGWEAFFTLNLHPEDMKAYLLEQEEQHPLGRLFDFDILRADGSKLSRQELGFWERTCLLCGNPAFLCGRSRTHSAQELLAKEIEIMENFFVFRLSNHIGQLMQKALFYEVNTSLKPGLVDRLHNGSHKDMCLSTFINSAYSITDYFCQCVKEGLSCDCSKKELPLLFQKLRGIGKQAEKNMLFATQGINTHKGIVFSGGILCAAIGYYISTNSKDISSENLLSSLSEICRCMLPELLNDYLVLTPDTAKTNGEKLYQEYKITGIRGEAKEGFPHLFNVGFPLFQAVLKKGFSLWQAGLITLLHYIAYTEDTNLIIRSDYQLACKIQKDLQQFLAHATYEEQLSILPKLDAFFISRNISPGGSADMLALTYFLYFIQNIPCPFL